MAMRLGVYGGSFNPPHHCHVLAVGLALSCGEVDRVLVIPTHQHPFDKVLAPFEDRLEMCRRAFSVYGERVEVSDLEARLEGPSFTLGTLQALAGERPDDDLRLVLGTDLLAETPRWKAFDQVAALARPLWIGRDGSDAPGEVIFPFRLPDVSSTEIRARVARGLDVGGLVPAAVQEYIRAGGLYRGPEQVVELLVLGLGRVGTALARWFAASGAVVRGWEPGVLDDPTARALDAAGVAYRSEVPLSVDAAQLPDLVIVAAPDAALGSIAQILDSGGIPGSVPAVHCSGAAPVRVLEGAGRGVGRMHPVFPFVASTLPLEDLAGLRLVLEGDGPATAAAAAVIDQAGGEAILVDGLDARRYHAACVMAANHLAALGMAAESLAEAAGLPKASGALALGRLMEASLQSCRRLGFRGGLTGPAARGDRETVQGHLDVLADGPPEVEALYRAANQVLEAWIKGSRD